MAEKQSYPMMPEKSWWTIRSQFKKTIPAVVNVSYLKSLLSLTSDQAAKNIMSPLRQMKIIDEEGKPLPRATDWRSDAKYSDVCSAIMDELYPQEMKDLFPDSESDYGAIKSWFMDTAGIGDSAATKCTATFLLLKNKQLKDDSEIPKTTKVQKPTKSITETKNVSIPVKSEDKEHGLSQSKESLSSSPSLHIDLQIHISPDATSEQIDKIFASISKHLYKS